MDSINKEEYRDMLVPVVVYIINSPDLPSKSSLCNASSHLYEASNFPHRYKNHKGFSLIEILVSLFIFSIGILGVLVMQITAKKMDIDTLQQSIAVYLAHDMVERIRSNPSAADDYLMDNLGASSSVQPMPDCISTECTYRQLASQDVWLWEQALTGVSEQSIEGRRIGGLVNPRACIVKHHALLTITIAWRGLPSGAQPVNNDCGKGLNLYGDGDEERRIVSLSTVLLK